MTTIRTLKRSACLVAATGLLSGAALATTAGGSSAAAPAAPDSGALTRSVASESSYPWTAEQMAAARPMDLLAPRAGSTRTPAPTPTGRAGAAAGTSPTGTALATESAPPAATPTSGSFSYPTPFDRYNIAAGDYKLFPHKATGKLFFTQNGGSFVCSASSVGNDAIWTAGHCVSDGAGHFSSNLVFVPAYQNGNAPYGRFDCNAIIVFSAWHSGGSLSRDSGGASCGRSSLGNGKTVQQSVGALGFAWNQPADSRHLNVLGYPQAAPFNGQLQVQCQSSFGHWDTRQSFSPRTFAVGCDSTGGVSGGPYVMSYRQGNFLNGNASYRYTTPDEKLELYTPYFDDSSKSLRDALIA